MRRQQFIKKLLDFLKAHMPKTPKEVINTGINWKNKRRKIQKCMQPLKTGIRLMKAMKMLMTQLSQSLEQEGLSLSQELPVLQSKRPLVRKILNYLKR